MTSGPGPDGLLVRYADAVRTGDAAAFAVCWTVDAAWDLNGPVVEGRDAIVGRFAEARRDLRGCTQDVAAGRWTALGHDRAAGRWVVHEDQDRAEGVGRLVGVYHDDVVRTADGWRFARRRFEPVWRGAPRVAGPLEAGSTVCCSGTLGAAPLLRKIAAVASVGFDGLSVYAREVDGLVADGWTTDEIRAVLVGVGLAVAEVDGRSTWSGLAGESGPPADHLVGIGSALGARSVTLLVPPGADLAADATRSQVARALAGVADVAAQAGLLVHLEPYAWSGLADLATALDLCRRSGAPAAGVLVDTWHLAVGPDRGHLPDDLPGDRVLGLHLGEAAEADPPDVAWAGMHDRRLPGEGRAVGAAVLRELRARGCTAPVGVEVITDDLHAGRPREAAATALAALEATVAAASGPVPTV